MQLFCYTFAGGTSDFYNEIESMLPSSIKVFKVDYAGHGKRHKDSLYTDYDELTKDMYLCLKEKLNINEDYALMGYSMGSITLATVLDAININNELPLPKHVFLAAHEPFTKEELAGFTTDELDEYVKERTIRFGGIPEKLLHSNVFWRVYLPIYRADYSIIGRFDFKNFGLCSYVPATVFYSPTDTPLEGMNEWSRFFKGKFELISYKGTHFFINQHCSEMANVIKERLNSYGI